MKNFIALILTILMCTAVLVACDDNTEPAPTPAPDSQATTTEPIDTTPIKVDSINGKTVKQLWSALGTTVFKPTSIEISIKDEDSELLMKMSGSNTYWKGIFKDDEEDNAECIVVDGVGYLSDSKGKYKYLGDTVEYKLEDYTYLLETLDEYIGEDFFAEIDETVFNGVDIFRSGNDYYFTLSITEDDETATFTLHFNESGAPTGMLATSEEFTLELSNINLPVAITSPADAADYIEYDPIDDQGLVLYQQACQKLASATSYKVQLSGFEYAKDTSGKESVRITSSGNGNIYYKNGNTYFDKTGAVIAAPTQDVIDMFSNGSSCIGGICTAIQESDMQSLSLTNSTKYIVSVSIDGGEYRYSFNQGMTEINVDVNMWRPSNQSLDYRFTEVNTGNVNIQIPSANS